MWLVGLLGSPRGQGMRIVGARSLGARRLCVVLAAGLALTATGLAGLVRPASADGTKPNFVLIVSDDQRWDTIGRCLDGFDGSDLAAGTSSCMPLLQEKLVANGTTFLRGHVTNSLCCPSRAGILTGQYSRHNGVTNNNSWLNFHDTSSLATWLDDDGYRTGLVGKYFNTYGNSSPGTPAGYVPPGWDSWHAFWGTPNYLNYSLIDKDPGGSAAVTAYNSASTTKPACAADNLYSTDQLCGRALQFLRSDQTDPFFLYFAPYSPHAPYTAPGRYTGTYASVATPTYPSLNQVPSPDPPSYLPTSPLSSSALATSASNFRKQLETNRAVDDAIGVLYQELADEGRLSNTVFVFLSDNGMAHGEDRLEWKECEFEICHKVPFVVVCPPAVCPGATPGRIDTTNDALNIDIAPTLAELAGATPGLVIDGSSLVPVLNDAGAPWRSWYTIDDKPGAQLNGLVSREPDGHTYKYVTGSGQPRLYDLDADPWELANLRGDGVHDALTASLAARLTDAITSPVATITSGPTGPSNQLPISFSWTSTKTATFGCGLDGVFQLCGSGTSGSFSYPVATEGPHTFTVNATDAYNNVGTKSRAFSLDTVPPPVPVITQSPPDPNEGPATFAFTDDEAGVSFLCSIVPATLTSCASPVSYTPSPGSRTFQVVAADSLGNRSSPVTFSWTQNGTGTPPTVTMLKPVADSLLTSKSVSSSWTGTDDQGIARYDVARRIGTAGVQTVVRSQTTTSYIFMGSTATTYCIQVFAYDGSGNQGVGEERCTAIPFDDRNASIAYAGTLTTQSVAAAFEGTLTVLSDGGRASMQFNGRRVGVLFRKDASSGIAQIRLDGVLQTTVDLYSATTKPKIYGYNAAVPAGVHTLEVVWTGTKNSRSSGTAVALDGIAVIAEDSIPPETTITSGPTGTVATPDATFEFSSSDAGPTYACSLDGQAFASCTSPVAYAGLGDGSHTFSVRATDPNGNTDATPATRTWTIATSPP
jgi:arylsulfatase A-like enzyme